jgi:hypothetical protein
MLRRASRALGVLAFVCITPGHARAHPGTGIVVDRLGNVYFVDMVSGVWKVDPRGTLTHLPGPGFHWLAMDESNALARASLPRGSTGDVVRLGAAPTLLLSSDVPIATGRDASLFYPSRGSRPEITRLPASGDPAVVARVSEADAKPWLNDLAAGPDGTLYFTVDDAVRKIDSRGVVTTVAQDLRLAPCASIPGIDRSSGPLLRGLAVDSAGTVYVAATGCGSVLQITRAGKVSKIVQVDGGWSPTGIAVSGNDVYVLEFLGAGSDDRRAMIPRVRRIGAGGASRIIATVSR